MDNKITYLVEGAESGLLGEYKTLAEAKKAIKEVKAWDMKEVGYTDTFTIEKCVWEGDKGRVVK